MRSHLYLPTLLAAVMVAAGCSVAVGGSAQPGRTVTPRSLSGQTITRVLLGRSALSRIVKQPMEIDPHFPLRFGGPEMLWGDGSGWSDDCAGVAVMLQQGAYRSSNVRHVAVETWRPVAMSAPVTRVKEGVVSLPTAADADALFAKFARQWQACDGKTISAPARVFRLKLKVSDVQVDASFLAAATSIELNLPDSGLASIPAGRAIGVRGNCLIEVEVDFVNASNPSLRGSGDANTAALDIAQIMRDKVTALS